MSWYGISVSISISRFDWFFYFCKYWLDYLFQSNIWNYGPHHIIAPRKMFLWCWHCKAPQSYWWPFLNKFSRFSFLSFSRFFCQTTKCLAPLLSIFYPCLYFHKSLSNFPSFHTVLRHSDFLWSISGLLLPYRAPQKHWIFYLPGQMAAATAFFSWLSLSSWKLWFVLSENSGVEGIQICYGTILSILRISTSYSHQ